MRKSGITVVKIGGSHAGAAHLGGCLTALAGCGGRAVIVPGGGPFADAVRTAQMRIGFDDATAHAMALLAMAQFGLVLAGSNPGFRIAASVTAIRQMLRAGLVPVWSPAAMVLRCKSIPASWDVTSDSLAAWLAGRIGAKRLFLIKHGTWDARTSAFDLAARGVVDPAFPRFLAASGVEASIVAPDDHGAAAEAVCGNGELGIHIDLHPHQVARDQSWPMSKRRVGAGL